MLTRQHIVFSIYDEDNYKNEPNIVFRFGTFGRRKYFASV